MPKPLVAYYRVSTREQGRSGLGLDAQRAAIARFAEVEGFEVAAEFTEVETGAAAPIRRTKPQKHEDRPMRAARCPGKPGK